VIYGVFLPLFTRVARQLVRALWPAIAELAELLLKRGTVLEPEIRALLQGQHFILSATAEEIFWESGLGPRGGVYRTQDMLQCP
jgi:hypothetical protein